MRGTDERPRRRTEMHQLIGIAVRIKDNPTEKEAVERADAYADDVLEQHRSFDYHKDNAETVHGWGSDAKTFRTDTDAGMRRLDEIKEEWKERQAKLLNEARSVLLENTDDNILDDNRMIWKIGRVGHHMESPLFGPDFSYIDETSSFKYAEKSWVVFFDFHS